MAIITKKGYSIVKMVLKGFTLLLTMYSIYTMPGGTTPLNTTLTVLMIIVWIASVVLEIFLIFFNFSRHNRIYL